MKKNDVVYGKGLVIKYGTDRKKYDKKKVLEVAVPLKCEGYTYREIAKLINVPKSTLHRYLTDSENIVKGVVDSWQASMR